MVFTSYAQALFYLSEVWWVLVGPGEDLGCPELGTATGRLSGWILTVAEDCRCFQGIYQYRIRFWASQCQTSWPSWLQGSASR